MGQDKVGSKEDNAGSHARFTVVIFASSDRDPQGPEVLFKAVDPARLRDTSISKVPTCLSVRFTSTATYDTESTVAMVNEKYSQRTLAQCLGRPWRGLLIDQFTAQLTPEALKAMISNHRVPIVI